MLAYPTVVTDRSTNTGSAALVKSLFPAGASPPPWACSCLCSQPCVKPGLSLLNAESTAASGELCLALLGDVGLGTAVCGAAHTNLPTNSTAGSTG